MKLKFIINLHRRIELKEIKLLIPKILRIYNKFAWKDEIEMIENFDTKQISNSRPIHWIKRMRTELELQYIINFNWGTKLKEAKTYIIALRAIITKKNVQGLKWISAKNSLADVSWRRQERESGGENSNDHWHVFGHHGAARAAPCGREHAWKSL